MSECVFVILERLRLRICERSEMVVVLDRLRLQNCESESVRVVLVCLWSWKGCACVPVTESVRE